MFYSDKLSNVSKKTSYMRIKSKIKCISIFAVCTMQAFASDIKNQKNSVVVSEAETPARYRNMLIVYEDNDRFFVNVKETTVEALRANVSRLAGGKITHLFLCPNGQRTSYNSMAHEPIWTPVFGKEPQESWAQNCKAFAEKGIDPYAVWIDECRKIGISPWISIRMNDVHYATKPDCFRNLNFWREHRKLWRVPQKELPTSGNWSDYAFNYKHKAVRDYFLLLVRELFERYDFDGFELDWLRFGSHLTPQNEQNETAYLTEFMREVRKIADDSQIKRGHKIGISARVHATAQIALSHGIDASEWAREGLVDILVPSCVYSSGDFAISVSQWREYLGKAAARVAVVPSVDNGFRPSDKVVRKRIDEELLNGWANAMYFSGADTLYLFNAFYQPKLLEEVAKRGLAKEKILSAHRRHPLTFRDMGKTADAREVFLPAASNAPREFKIEFGKKPPIDESAKILVNVGFKQNPKFGGIKVSKLCAKLNGFDAKKFKESSTPQKYGNAERALSFYFDYSALKSGANIVRIESLDGNPVDLIWVELEYFK